MYLPAATATNTPTATDSIAILTSLTMVGTGTSDRLLHMQGSSDKKNFRMWIYSGGTLQREYFIEQASSTVVAGLNWTNTTIVGQRGANTAANSSGGTMGTPATSLGTSNNAYAKIGGTVCFVGGGGEVYLDASTYNSTFTSSAPQLNGGGIIVPLCFATNTSLMNGKIGNCIDSWFAYINGAVDGSAFGSSPSYQFMYLNNRVVPWDGNNPAILT